MNPLHKISFTLLIIGGLNWGLEAFDYNVIYMIFGSGSISMLIYVLVGLAAIYEIISHKSLCRNCAPSASGQM